MGTEFLEFWSAYPRKVGKLIAHQIFEAAIRRGYAASDIIVGAKAFAEMCRREHTEMQFVPHPKTWLRAGQWMDETLGSYQPIDPERAAADRDTADRLLKRGEYDPLKRMQ